LGIASLAVAAVIGSALLLRRHVEPPLPVLFTLPAFSLLDTQGHALGSAQLAGRPYVADFIYTACHDQCPMLTARMGQLQDRLQRDPQAVRLVSFTVDPEHDTPEKLAEYSRNARAIPGLWIFLTGSRQELATLLSDGFKVSMETSGEAVAMDGGTAERDHDGHLVLVDARGRVRGYFPPTEEGLAQIRSALKDLLLGG
jgi:protein SCO1/2